MTYLLTQVPTLGTVPQEEGPHVSQRVWKGALGWGGCDWRGGASGRVHMESCGPTGLGDPIPCLFCP